MSKPAPSAQSARVVFMGTPAFAVPSLRALAQNHSVVGVVTQPDAPAGRGGKLAMSPVKLAALELGLAVLQPASLKSPDAVAQLRALAPELVVVAAFGQILRRDVLELPPYGCVNVHASLLPRWRGASPISAAIAAGDAVTGVTLMRMDVGLDTGPTFARGEVAIAADDTTGSLTARLADLGARLLAEVLSGYLSGALAPQPQDDTAATLCRTLKKDDGRIIWSREAVEIERHVRAMSPWPSAFSVWDGKRLKVLRARVVARDGGAPAAGRVFADGERIFVRCGDGALELLDVQLEGKNAMSAAAFLRGNHAIVGAQLT